MRLLHRSHLQQRQRNRILLLSHIPEFLHACHYHQAIHPTRRQYQCSWRNEERQELGVSSQKLSTHEELPFRKRCSELAYHWSRIGKWQIYPLMNFLCFCSLIQGLKGGIWNICAFTWNSQALSGLTTPSECAHSTQSGLITVLPHPDSWAVHPAELAHPTVLLQVESAHLMRSKESSHNAKMDWKSQQSTKWMTAAMGYQTRIRSNW